MAVDGRCVNAGFAPAAAPNGAADETDPYFVLEFCDAAILDAITLEDGLDAETGQRVRTMISAARAALAPHTAALASQQAECARLRDAWSFDGKLINQMRTQVEGLYRRLSEADAARVAAERALEPFAEFARQWNRQPMKGMADEFYCIHTGTEYEASLKRSDLQRAADVLAAKAACPHGRTMRELCPICAPPDWIPAAAARAARPGADNA
jgi:hypothetical protein